MNFLSQILSVFFLILTVECKAELCKKGDVEDCIRYLRTKNYLARSGREAHFSEYLQEFNDICNENPSFKCTKTIVRGNIDNEISELTKEYQTPESQPTFFKVKHDQEEMLFMIQKKSNQIGKEKSEKSNQAYKFNKVDKVNKKQSKELDYEK